jgi:hypothetical protein
MKKQKQIIIEVDENGKIVFETDGFIGEECVQNEIVNHIKNALGRGLGPEFKPVFYQKNQQRVTHKNFCG